MHATFVTLWLQVVQPLANVHEPKWTTRVKRETDVAQSYTSSAGRSWTLMMHSGGELFDKYKRLIAKRKLIYLSQ